LSTAKFNKPNTSRYVKISRTEYRRLKKDAERWRWYSKNIFTEESLDAYDTRGLIKIVDDFMKGKRY
jgi:hypothetical protein